MITLGIDPGYSKAGKGCACALSRDGQIFAAWFERPPRRASLLAHACDGLQRIVIEKPEQRANGGRGVPPETLIELTWAGCALGHLYGGFYGAEMIWVTPAAWKGSVPKPIHHRDLWDKLTPAECKIFGGAASLRTIDEACEKGALERWKRDGASYYPKGFTTHNLLDAAALCRWLDVKQGTTKCRACGETPRAGEDLFGGLCYHCEPNKISVLTRGKTAT